MDFKKIWHSLLPFTFIVLMLLITYWGNQWYFGATGIVGRDYSYILLWINQQVPFQAWWIYPYVIAYPFWGLSFFYIGYRSKKAMYTIVSIVLFTFTIAGLTYFFLQSDVQAWRETSGLFARDPSTFSPAEALTFWIYNHAGPRNANPSMHVLMSWLTIIGVRMDKKMPIVPKIVIWVLAIAITISTQTLKQHYIIDVITAIVLAEVFYFWLRKSPFVDKVEAFFTKLNKKVHLES